LACREKVAYRELEAHHAERDLEAMVRLGEGSPLVAEVLDERDRLKDTLLALQEEQAELVNDVDKAVGKVADQDEVIRALSDQLQELMSAVNEQGEDLRVLLEENGFLRSQIDRVSRVAASAALTRDKEKSAAWTKEVSDLGASIQSSVADELRSAYDEVRSTHKDLSELRGALAAAQEQSVAQSHRMADHLRGFRQRLDEVNDVEVRLAELHDQALAVGAAHEKMNALEAAHADYRARAEKRMIELEASSRPPADIRDVNPFFSSTSFHSFLFLFLVK
jgi:chromosome segregation ATPase